MSISSDKRWDAILESQRDTIMRGYGEVLQSLDKSSHVASAQLVGPVIKPVA